MKPLFRKKDSFISIPADNSVMNSIRVLVSFLVLAGVLSAGCISVPELPGNGDFVAGTGVPGVSVNLVRSEPSFSPSRGCVWEVTLQVYNTREAEVRNVNLHLELVDTESAAVRDSMDIFAGTIPGGESMIVKAELDGDCINEYLLRATPVLL
jgi:hypothetical protein